LFGWGIDRPAGRIARSASADDAPRAPTRQAALQQGLTAFRNDS
jgi:hypothetical protein